MCFFLPWNMRKTLNNDNTKLFFFLCNLYCPYFADFKFFEANDETFEICWDDFEFFSPNIFAMPFIQKWNESYNKFEESYCERVENITFFLQWCNKRSPNLLFFAKSLFIPEFRYIVETLNIILNECLINLIDIQIM